MGRRLIRHQVSHATPSRSAPPREELRIRRERHAGAAKSGRSTRANAVYDHWGQSLDAYEQSAVSAFSSKFDAFLEGKYTLTADEMAGYKLFNGKGNCNSCHLDGEVTTLTPVPGRTPAQPQTQRALFTCFGSANLGCPRIRGMHSIIRPRRIPSGSRPIPKASPTEISE